MPRAGIGHRALEAAAHDVVRLLHVPLVEADPAAEHREAVLLARHADVLGVAGGVLRSEIEPRAVVVDRRELRHKRAGLLRADLPADVPRAGVVRDAALRRAEHEPVVAAVAAEDGRHEQARELRLLQRPAGRGLHGDPPAHVRAAALRRTGHEHRALLETAVDEPRRALRALLERARLRVVRRHHHALREVVRARELEPKQRRGAVRRRKLRAVRRHETRHRALRLLVERRRERRARHLDRTSRPRRKRRGGHPNC